MENLKNLLQQKGISRMRLAIMAGMAPADLYCIMSGKRIAYPGWRKRIAAALGMSEDDVFPEYSSKLKE